MSRGDAFSLLHFSIDRKGVNTKCSNVQTTAPGIEPSTFTWWTFGPFLLMSDLTSMDDDVRTQ
jgi:hypothetical protein